MITGVEVVGADRLASTAHRAAQELDTLQSDDAARLVAKRAQAEAPKVSGRLAASVHTGKDGNAVTVSSRLIYAGVIHNGWAAHNISANPFLARAAVNSQGEIARNYTAEADKVLGHVKGA